MENQINIETFRRDFRDVPLSNDETWHLQNGYITESDLIDMRVQMKRELTYKELEIMRILEENAVLISVDDFKPFPG